MSTIDTPSIYQDIAAGRAYPVGLTVEVYDFMLEQGVLEEDVTTELIDGVIVKKDRSAAGEDPMSIGERHRLGVLRLARHAPTFEARGCYLQTQQPIVLPPANEPEPDGSVIRGRIDDNTGKPRGPEVLAVIEVADSSLHRDLGPKLRAYAAASIPQYVVADLQHDVVLVHTAPAADAYTQVREHRRGELVSISAGEAAAVAIPVEHLLG